MHDKDIILSLAQAEEMIGTALVANKVSPENATTVAHALVNAEADGQKGHGLSRVTSYAAQAASGKVDGKAVPLAVKAADAWIAIDAGNGFSYPAISLALSKLVELAPKAGIACATIHRSHHCGQLGAHVEKLAEHGLVALMFANTPKAMAPWGGAEPLFGTNPIAFAAPRTDELPLVIDLSLSKVARGKIMAAAKTGQAIPEGWALDREGNPTTDAKAALAGTMIPAGNSKGAALALMVEIFAATLTGSNYGFEASSFFDADGPPPSVGQTIIVLSPRDINGRNFAARIETLLQAMLGQEGVRLPGMRRFASRDTARRDGIAVPAHIYAEISALLAQ